MTPFCSLLIANVVLMPLTAAALRYGARFADPCQRPGRQLLGLFLLASAVALLLSPIAASPLLCAALLP